MCSCSWASPLSFRHKFNISWVSHSPITFSISSLPPDSCFSPSLPHPSNDATFNHLTKQNTGNHPLFLRMACGVLVPRPGIEPAPPAVEAQSLNHWTAREVPGNHPWCLSCPAYPSHLLLYCLLLSWVLFGILFHRFLIDCLAVLLCVIFSVAFTTCIFNLPVELNKMLYHLINRVITTCFCLTPSVSCCRISLRHML